MDDNKNVRKLTQAIEKVSKAVERLAAAKEALAEPVTAEAAPTLTLLTWEDAVRILRYTCVEAPECGPGCPMYGWCWSNLPPRNAPEYWTEPGAGE